MLPQRVYESLPYLYIAVGLGILCGVRHPYALISALVFVCAGAFVWIERSRHRRTRHRLGALQDGLLPFWCYEMLPFSYLALGVSLMVYSDNLYMYPSAVILTVIGLQVWTLRALQRRPSRHFQRAAG